MEITANDVRGRNRAHQLAVKDPKAALKLAKSIAHAWYRCQALTAAAEYLGGQQRKAALGKALAAAKEQHEPNRIVTVASWPVRLLAETDPKLAAEAVAELVDIAETESHNLRRAHALQALAFATSQHVKLQALVIPALVEALLGGHGPRIDRVIRDTYELVRITHPHMLRPLAMHHKANAQQQKLLVSLPQDAG